VEGPLLPYHRHPLSQLPGDDGEDRMEQVRRGQGRALRPMHDALRVRTIGGNRGRKELEGYLGDDSVEHDVALLAT